MPLPPTGYWSSAPSSDAKSLGHQAALRSQLTERLITRVGRQANILFGDAAESDSALAESSFLIPILTPEFLRDPQCMRTVRLFREMMTARGRADLILPVHYQDVTAFRTGAGRTACADPDTLAYLVSLPWRDFRSLPNRDPQAPEARSALAKLSNDIVDVLKRKTASRDSRRVRPPVIVAAAWGLLIAAFATAGLYFTGLLSPVAVAPLATRTASRGPSPSSALPRQVQDCAYCPVMQLIPAGSFVMGTPKTDARGYNEERPYHSVTIAEPFYLGQTPVTVGEYRAFVRENPDYDPGREWSGSRMAQSDRDPVVNVNYYDIAAYAAWLRRLTGKQFTLPTEAQWEYAARGGNRAQGAYYWGDGFKDGAGYIPPRGHGGTIPVKTTKEYDFGLYDVLGHVWQWTADSWHPNYEGAPKDGSAWLAGGNKDRCPLRGGSWYSTAEDVRIAVRDDADRRDRLDIAGFRLARPVD